MNSYKVITLLLLFFFKNEAFSQSDYEIVFLGEYKNPVAFNKTKNWYFISESLDKYKQRTDQLIRIDTDKDLHWDHNKKDSIYLLKKVGAIRKFSGRILIGTFDTLFENKHTMASWNFNRAKSPGILQIGYIHEVNLQGFRDSSPFINFYVTGKVEITNYNTEVTEYNMTVICEFDEMAYYDVAHFGGKRFKENKSFLQPINPLVKEYLQREGLDSESTIRDAYLIHSGYLDKDYLIDFLVIINGRYYLFLSYRHDLDNGKVFHIEKAWKDIRVPFEF
jgi:hypothetical protein